MPKSHGPLFSGEAKDTRRNLPLVTIYTDGGCMPNPGYGGWGVLLIYVSPETGEITERELSGTEAPTTNNRMEMVAAIAALESLKRPCAVTLYSDSLLLVKGAREWLKGWKATGWKKGKIANRDLWERLDAAMMPHRMKWRWVKGHSGIPENERVDALATAAIMSSMPQEAAPL